MKKLLLILLLIPTFCYAGWISTIASLNAASSASDAKEASEKSLAAAQNTEKKIDLVEAKMNEIIKTMNDQSAEINRLHKKILKLEKINLDTPAQKK